jgi:hypothetical protein
VILNVSVNNRLLQFFKPGAQRLRNLFVIHRADTI